MNGSLGPILVGLFGSGTIAALARIVFTRGKTAAEAEAIRIGTLDQVVQTLSARVDKLDTEVAYLRCQLANRDRENTWLKARCHQLEDFIRSMNLPVPHPVPVIEEEP